MDHQLLSRACNYIDKNLVLVKSALLWCNHGDKTVSLQIGLTFDIKYKNNKEVIKLSFVLLGMTEIIFLRRFCRSGE